MSLAVILPHMTAYASDRNYDTHTFSGGVTAGSYHYFNYVDVKCGANSYITYQGASSSKIDIISVDWKAYNVGGPVVDSSYIKSLKTNGVFDQSKKDVLEKSYAKFLFDKGGNEWRPASTIYNCAFSSFLAPTIKENKMPETYKSLVTKNSKDQLQIAKSIIQEYYSTDLSEFTLNNRPITIDDFKLGEDNKTIGKTFKEEKLKLSFTREEQTEFSFVNIYVPEVVKKDNTEYSLKAYVLINDNNGVNDRLDVGLVIDKIENK